MFSIKLDSHQPIWESSRRPLHPKYVWIESFGTTGALNGSHRHFIFDYNLSNSERLRNEASSFVAATINPSFDAIDTKMSSLSIIGSGDRMFNSLGDQTEHGFDFLMGKETITSLDLPDEEATAIKSPENSKEMSTTPSSTWVSNDIDWSKNVLAERVLQWLDLAGGRGQMSTRRSDNIGKLFNASKRRSVTAKEPRKINQMEDEHGEHITKIIKRESIRQLSMTFIDENNTDSKSPQLSINQKIISLSFSDLFPVTYKSSRKFLSFRRPTNFISEGLEPLDLQSSLPLKSARKSTKHFNGRTKAKRLDYFDDQYRPIIQRQILETSCNIQAAKRQLHIFIPNLPRRCLIINDGSDKLSTLLSPNSGSAST